MPRLVSSCEKFRLRISTDTFSISTSWLRAGYHCKSTLDMYGMPFAVVELRHSSAWPCENFFREFKMKKPVNINLISQLIEEISERGEPIPDTWYVGWDGQPLWAQSLMPFSMIAGGMRIQPRMDGPEYRIVDFEDYPDHKISIVRLCRVGTDEEREFLDSQVVDSEEGICGNALSEDDVVSRFPIPKYARVQTNTKSFSNRLLARLRSWFRRDRREYE